MSVVTITFASQRDIKVDIDNIDDMSPRAIGMAIEMVNKKFLGMKGANLFALKREAEAAAMVKAEEDAKAVRIEQLKQEELSKHHESALAAATERFDKLGDDDKAALLAAHKADEATKELKEFLSNVATAVAGGKVESAPTHATVEKKTVKK